MLDVDGNDALEIEEFVHGIIHSQQPDKPSELLLLVQMSKAMLSVLNALSDAHGCQTDGRTTVPSSMYRMTLLGMS